MFWIKHPEMERLSAEVLSREAGLVPCYIWIQNALYNVCVWVCVSAQIEVEFVTYLESKFYRFHWCDGSCAGSCWSCLLLQFFVFSYVDFFFTKADFKQFWTYSGRTELRSGMKK